MIVLLQAAYAIAIGALVMACTTLIGRVLQARGRPERMVWAGGIVLALGLPFLLPLLSTPALATAEAGTSGIGPIVVLDFTPAAIAVTPNLGIPGLGVILLTLWASLSVLLAARLVSSLRTVARIRDRARPLEDGSNRIFVTHHHGPAVVGFLRPIILVPEWILSLSASRRRWVLRHELEHIRGGDPWLLGLILSSRILMPWNPVVWRLGAKLRAAIETDCDRRTLGDERESVLDYGEALIAVAGGPSPVRNPLPGIASAFAEPRLPLEDRIRSLTTPPQRVSGFVKTVLAGTVALVAVVACEVPTPMNESEPEYAEVESPPSEGLVEVPADELPPSTVELPPPPDEVQVSLDAEVRGEVQTAPAETDPPDPAEGPTFIPFDVQPVVQNRAEVRRVLEREYPPLLKNAGIGGEALVWIYIDPQGAVQDVRLNTSSGYDALDQAALTVSGVMQFSPAMNRDRAVAVWVAIPITFTASN